VSIAIAVHNNEDDSNCMVSVSIGLYEDELDTNHNCLLIDCY